VAQVAPAPEGSHLDHHTFPGEVFAILVHGELGKHCGLFGRQRSFSPANPKRVPFFFVPSQIFDDVQHPHPTDMMGPGFQACGAAIRPQNDQARVVDTLAPRQLVPDHGNPEPVGRQENIARLGVIGRARSTQFPPHFKGRLIKITDPFRLRGTRWDEDP